MFGHALQTVQLGAAPTSNAEGRQLQNGSKTAPKRTLQGGLSKLVSLDASRMGKGWRSDNRDTEDESIDFLAIGQVHFVTRIAFVRPLRNRTRLWFNHMEVLCNQANRPSPSLECVDISCKT